MAYARLRWPILARILRGSFIWTILRDSILDRHYQSRDRASRAGRHCCSWGLSAVSAISGSVSATNAVAYASCCARSRAASAGAGHHSFNKYADAASRRGFTLHARRKKKMRRGEIVIHKNGWVTLESGKSVRGEEARRQLMLARRRYLDRRRREFINRIKTG